MAFSGVACAAGGGGETGVSLSNTLPFAMTFPSAMLLPFYDDAMNYIRSDLLRV